MARTVVFSDETVAAEINARFVSAWTNKKPTVRFQDGIYDFLPKQTYATLPLGTGVDNVTAIFALPDGRVVNAIPGYLDVASFRREMRFAIDLAKRVALFEKPAVAAEVARRAHAAIGVAPETESDPRHVAARAHAKLAKVGAPTLAEIGLRWFDDFAPPMK